MPDSVAVVAWKSVATFFRRIFNRLLIQIVRQQQIVRLENVMRNLEDFTDQRLKAWCIHCGGSMSTLDPSRDHAPSKGLLVEPYPSNLPVVSICKGCNQGFSADEEYLAAFLSSVLAGSTEPERQQHAKASRILETKPSLRSRIDKSKTEYETLGGDKRVVWRPEDDRVRRVLTKNARGHAFFEYGEPMLNEPKNVWFAPLEHLTQEQREDFENTDFGSFWPEVGSRMMTRMLTGHDLYDGWIIVQNGVYRYAVGQVGTMIVRMVLFEYLAAEILWED